MECKCKQNIGKTDRLLRMVAGVIIISLGLFSKSWLTLIGVVLLVTAAVRICPAYIPLGISTDKQDA